MTKKNNSVLKSLENILSTKDFDQLVQFQSPTIWKKIPSQEKELLAQLFIMQGIEQLKKGNKEVLDSFDIANKIAPNNIKLLLGQARALALEKKHVQCLDQAHKILEQILIQDPTCFPAWTMLGTVLGNLGVIYNESNYYSESLAAFVKAEQYVSDPTSLDYSEFYWNQGICWYNLGRHSGEAHDFYNAVDSLKKVNLEIINNKFYWNDLSNAYIDLALLTNQKELLNEAIAHAQVAIKMDENDLDGWYNQAIAFQHLYDLDGFESTFHEAQQSFEKVCEINPDKIHAWFKWGILYLSACKKRENLDYLKKSIDKFEKANSLDPENPGILSRWAEALIWLGAHTERFDLMREAEKKISHAIEISPENPDLWHNYGFCLNELGTYFRDARYYQKAIEKFQKGLSYNPTSQLLWYGLAISHFSISEIEEDPAHVEKALSYFARAYESEEDTFPQLWNDWAISLMKMAELTNEKSYVQEAIHKFEKGLCIQERFDEFSADAEWWYHYGCALDFLGDFETNANLYEKAISALTKALQLDTSHPHVRFNLGLAYSHLGELTSEIECFQKALEYLQEALSKDSEDGVIWNEIGVTLINIAELIKEPIHPDRSQKVFEQAEVKFLRALSLGCNDALYNLVCLYSLSGNFNAAMHYLEKADRAEVLPEIESLMHDDWIEPLRYTTNFRNFIHQLSLKQGLEEQI